MIKRLRVPFLAEVEDNFLLQSQFLCVCRLLFHFRFTAVACKYAGDSAKSASGRLLITNKLYNFCVQKWVYERDMNTD